MIDTYFVSTGQKFYFSIPQLPPSYNKAININYSFHEVYLSPEAHTFKNLVKMSIAPEFTIPPDSYFKLTITYHSNWFYKNNKPRKLDIQNLDKLLIDAIFEQLGFGDERVWELQQFKVQSEEIKTEVMVEILEREDINELP